MFVRACVLVAATIATAALLGCPGARPPSVSPVVVPTIDDTALRIRIARAEAMRGGGLDELIELAMHGDATHGAHARHLALRGLGRIGGTRAIATLYKALAESDPDIIGAAAAALGVAASLDEPDEASTKAHGEILVAALPRSGSSRPRVLEALGRAGDPSVQAVLGKELGDPDARVREAATIALGRHGRRKLVLARAGRAFVIAATRDVDPSVRYAATWALAREHMPAGDGPAGLQLAQVGEVQASLTERVRDASAEVRAQAILAFARRKIVPDSSVQMWALMDRDWRVVVEGLRALAGNVTAQTRVRSTIAHHAGTLGEVARPDGSLERTLAAHIVIEGLRVFAPHMTKSDLADVLAIKAALGAETADAIAPLTRSWIRCLAEAALARADASITLATVDGCGDGQGLPAHLRTPLVTELAAAKLDTLANRWLVVTTALAHADARVRAAGIAVLPALWAESDGANRAAAIAAVLGALASKDPIIVGTALEAVPALFATTGTTALAPPDRVALESALVTRARSERDPELVGAVLELIGKHKIVAGVATCREALDGHPVRSTAARACLIALGEAAPSSPVAIAALPPVDVATVIGKRLVWRLVTSRGTITIALRPDVAPWAVASIVALTNKGFYDGLAFHRVVPNFVVQGGDPTMSGTGGPGYTLPAEPGALADGPGFVTGGVGIADAGRDSGGSQWFIMHSRAPHLDGRYTWIGAVEKGQNVADSLQIGDAVLEATIEARP